MNVNFIECHYCGSVQPVFLKLNTVFAEYFTAVCHLQMPCMSVIYFYFQP